MPALALKHRPGPFTPTTRLHRVVAGSTTSLSVPDSTEPSSRRSTTPKDAGLPDTNAIAEPEPDLGDPNLLSSTNPPSPQQGRSLSPPPAPVRGAAEYIPVGFSIKLPRTTLGHVNAFAPQQFKPHNSCTCNRLLMKTLRSQTPDLRPLKVYVVVGRAMSSGRAVSDTHNAQQPFDSASQLYRDVSDLHPVPSPSHAALMDASRFDDFAFAYQGLPEQPSLASLTDQANTSQSPTAFPQHQPMSAIPPNGLHFGTMPPGHRSQSMEGSDVAPDRTSPVSNALEDSATDEFGLASRNRADGTDLGGKPKEDKADSAPAWSELKTKAGKERKRLPLACIACRRKKIRCSGEKPACKHCLRSRIPCVYKVTTRKAAPRTDYMAMLDKRLKRMEERIIKVIPKSDQESTASVTRAVVKPAIPGSVPSAKSGKKRGAEEAFGPDLEAWAKAPSKSKIAGDDRPSTLQVQEAEENKLQHEGSEALPSKEIQEHLAEVFFDNIYGQSYHLLHKPSYMRKLKNGTLPPVLVLSVCAVAARFTSNPQMSSSGPEFLCGEEWASAARDICTRRYEWPNLTILTCLLILGLHEFGTCQGGRSWALGGQAIRMAFALQLHKDLEYDPSGRNGNKTQLSFIDREIRRRIMWACFLMDRFNSSGTDRPTFVREETIQIPLPVKEKYFQLDMPAPTETLDGQVLHPVSPDDGQLADTRENMGVAAYLIRGIALWGRIITYLSQGGKDTDPGPMWDPESQYAMLLKDVQDLDAGLPSSLKYSLENLEVHKTENTASQFLFMHVCLQHNILFMSRAAMSARKQQGVHDDFFSEASKRTFNAANRISDLFREAEQSRCFVSAPFAGYCAFSSTTVHILGIISRNPSMKPTAEANLTTNVKYLHKMKKYWGMFHWMVEDVRTQYRNALDAMRAGATPHERAAQSSFLQYGDWFNRYPHGLSDAEFMDPVTHKRKDSGADGVLEAKPELQSVEEYFSTLPTTQNMENKDSSRIAAGKRKPGPKKPTSAPGQQQLESMTNPDVETTPAAVQQQRRFSEAMGMQTSGPTGFSPLTVPNSQNPAFSNAMSPMSPAGMAAFAHHAQMPTFFPPELLSMNFGQGANGTIHPLDRQLVFGGYSMDTAAGLTSGQDMMGGIDWDTLAAGAQPDGGLQARRSSAKPGINGQAPGVVDGSGTLGGPEASSAWFMPFNMEPPEMGQDPGLSSMSGVDPFAGMFSGGGSGLATPNPLSGLQQRGP
ncbi:nitrate assimilation regulatory nirA [Fusarium albosuccineum]|uniref:Nitrate assimilation regulatory nirA n=1 Tax=Fusarium albosuccineum TaxID=1237068 RepID=A0A8H4LLY7_9HYPO|nr:nitrate assimilation regulatory nirA [Fusarium albosuccineum]